MRAKAVNERSASHVSEDVSLFLVEAVDARRMDFQEGKLAAERGSRQDVRQYGVLMMKEQTLLLDELIALAAAKQVSVPATLGRTKAGVLKDMQDEFGERLDKMFIRTITIDHERDVKEFAKASAFDDIDVQDFASKRLPMIRSHLDGINAIAGRQ